MITGEKAPQAYISCTDTLTSPSLIAFGDVFEWLYDELQKVVSVDQDDRVAKVIDGFGLGTGNNRKRKALNYLG